MAGVLSHLFRIVEPRPTVARFRTTIILLRRANALRLPFLVFLHGCCPHRPSQQ
jgi:hypothetical protein